MGLILVILLFVLLCPIVYKASGKFTEESKNIKIRFHYLLGLVRGGYTYPEPGNIYLKAAWFTIYDSKADDNNVKNAVNDDSINEKSTEITAEISENKSTDRLTEKSAANDISKSEIHSKKIKADDSESQDTIDNQDAIDNPEPKTDKKQSSDNKAKEKHYNPIYHIKKAYEAFRHKIISKIKLLFKDISFYKKLIEHDDTKALISKFKKQLIGILKQIFPKKGRCDLVYGFDSPDITAYIFGIYSLIMHNKSKKYILVPNFEEKVILGDFSIKGYFNLFGIVIKIIPILLSKKLRITKNRIDKHLENMNAAKRKEEKKHNKNLKDLEEEYSA